MAKRCDTISQTQKSSYLSEGRHLPKQLPEVMPHCRSQNFFLQLAHSWYLGVSISQEQAQLPTAYLAMQKHCSHNAVTSKRGWKNSQLQDSEINPELHWKQSYPGALTTQTPPSEMDG